MFPRFSFLIFLEAFVTSSSFADGAQDYSKLTVDLTDIPNPFVIKDGIHHFDKMPSFAQLNDLQKKLRLIDVKEIVTKLYEETKDPKTTFADFYGRVMNGARQMLINEEHGLFPRYDSITLGRGGSNCLVTSGKMARAGDISRINKTIDALPNFDFHGQFIYRQGGFANPTGKEYLFAGVPYVIKIFEMIQAEVSFGCENILWIDSSAIPLKSPAPLFEIINEKNGLFRLDLSPKHHSTLIFPHTRKLLQNLTGVDVLTQPGHLVSIVFGFKIKNPLIQDFIREYYEMARRGTPFLSCYPEEFVMGAILGQPKYKSLAYNFENQNMWSYFYHHPH